MPRAAPPWSPQLASTDPLAAESSADWWFERKLDGIRAIVTHAGGDTRLRTRSDADRSDVFPELLAGVAALGVDDLVLDAEVVAFDPDGRDDLGGVQRRLHARPRRGAASRRARGSDTAAGATGSAGADRGWSLRLVVFDVLRFEGTDLRGEPLRARREVLDRLGIAAPLDRTRVRTGDASTLLDEACAAGWEGLIAKRPDAPYRAGRSTTWRKLVCAHDQLVVVGGWTPPAGGGGGVGALLVGRPAGGPAGHDDAGVQLTYLGRVGSGIDQATSHALATHLERAAIDDPPFTTTPPRPPGGGPAPRWCVPHLVARVRSHRTSPGGALRHARLRRLHPELTIADADAAADPSAAPSDGPAVTPPVTSNA